MTRRETVGYTIIGVLMGVVLFLCFTLPADAHVRGGFATEYQGYLDADPLNKVHHLKVTSKAPAQCAGALGCTWKGGPLYINRNQVPFQRELTFLHEMAHQYDYRELDDQARGAIRTAIGYPSTHRWWDYFQPVGEEFAEAYAWCAVGQVPDQTAAYGVGDWGVAKFARVCEAITVEA